MENIPYDFRSKMRCDRPDSPHLPPSAERHTRNRFSTIYAKAKLNSMLGRNRPWPDLPDLVILSIATRFSSVRDLLAFGGASKAWRYVVLREALKNLIQRQPLTLLVRPQKTPEGILVSYYRQLDGLRFGSPGIVSFIRSTDGQIFQRNLDPDLCFLSHSHAHLVMVHYQDLSSVVLVNIFTGVHKKFPPAPRPFRFANLSRPPTSSNCLLVLVSSSVIQYWKIGGTGSWTVFEYREGIIPETWVADHEEYNHYKFKEEDRKDKLYDAVAIKDRLYAITRNHISRNFRGKLLEIKIDHPTASPQQVLDRPRSYREIEVPDIGPLPRGLTELNGNLIVVPGIGYALRLINSSTPEWNHFYVAPWEPKSSDNRCIIFGMTNTDREFAVKLYSDRQIEEPARLLGMDLSGRTYSVEQSRSNPGRSSII